MPKKTIEIGRTPNDGTGDNLILAFAKVNENIDDIYIEKQDTLISGTNIKTINGSSILGSGDLVISGGSSGLKGVHALMPLASADKTSSAMISNANGTGGPFTINRLVAYPFIPNQSFTSSNIQMAVSGATVGSLCRLAVYSDLNGLPDTSIFISSDLNCSTTGLKTANASISFVAGTTYWLAFHGNATATSINLLVVAQTMSLKNLVQNTAANNVFRDVTFISGTPTTFGAVTYAGNNIPLILITKA